MLPIIGVVSETIEKPMVKKIISTFSSKHRETDSVASQATKVESERFCRESPSRPQLSRTHRIRQMQSHPIEPEADRRSVTY